jgi:hypothetical protein
MGQRAVTLMAADLDGFHVAQMWLVAGVWSGVGRSLDFDLE